MGRVLRHRAKVEKMPRIESPALRSIESEDAKNRVRASEDRLMASMERFGAHVLKRRRAAAAANKGCDAKPTNQVTLSEPQRSKIRVRFKELVEAAS